MTSVTVKGDTSERKISAKEIDERQKEPSTSKLMIREVSLRDSVLLESTVDGVSGALSLRTCSLDTFTTVLAVETRVGEPFDSDVLTNFEVSQCTVSDGHDWT